MSDSETKTDPPTNEEAIEPQVTSREENETTDQPSEIATSPPPEQVSAEGATQDPEPDRAPEDSEVKRHSQVNDDVTMTFPQRLMEILSNEDHDEIISWLPHGRGFMIYKKKMFETQIMPKYFNKNSKYTSFTRKLNRWGFIRVTRGPEMGAYYHKFFKKGESRLCMQMSCQRPTMATASSSNNGYESATPPAIYSQMAMQQQHSGTSFPVTSIATQQGGHPNAYLQMQQQHMQLLMRHREQMIQREAALRSGQAGGGGAPINREGSTPPLNVHQTVQGMKQSNVSSTQHQPHQVQMGQQQPVTSGQQMNIMMHNMMEMQQRGAGMPHGNLPPHYPDNNTF